MMKRVLLGFLLLISGTFLFINIKKYKAEIIVNEDLALYVDSELQDNIPKKGEATFIKSVCDNNVKATWDNDKWGLLVTNMTKKTKCNLYFSSYVGDTIFNFDYTGAEQTFTAPVSGTYKLETWGAQGGNVGNYSGGAGGFAKGIINLKAAEILYINIGGSGNTNSYLGGYNGGGSIRNDNMQYNFNYGRGGGGATHIAIKSGVLSSLENYKSNILIVSGGGGGANNRGSADTADLGYGEGAGGAGGGFIGKNGTSVNSWNGFGYGYGTGGTQSSAGIEIWTSGTGIHDNSAWFVPGNFGQGSTINTTSEYGSQSGGGGGYYGGGPANHGGGGGGSGYIGNSLLKEKAMYCYNCEESNEEATKTISTTCGEETPTENCAKKGNGYARITLISIDE